MFNMAAEVLIFNADDFWSILIVHKHFEMLGSFLYS